MLKITETALVLLYSALWLVQKTRVTLFQPIRCEIKIIHNLVARVFPRFTESSYFYFEFSLAVRRISLSSVWPLLLQWFGFTHSTEKYSMFYAWGSTVPSIFPCIQFLPGLILKFFKFVRQVFFSSSDLELWFYFYLSTCVWWFEQIELDALDHILIMLQINQG